MNDPIRAKIIELVPEIDHGEIVTDHSKVTLADVLRAIEEYRNSLDEEKQEWWSVDTRGEFLQLPAIKGILPCWNLALGYDNQPQEVKNLIGRLLGVTT